MTAIHECSTILTGVQYDIRESAPVAKIPGLGLSTTHVRGGNATGARSMNRSKNMLIE